MALYLDNFDCLFNDFGEPARIERTGEILVVKHDLIESLHDLSLAKYKNCSGVAWLKFLDKNKIERHDMLTLLNSAQTYRVEHKMLEGGGLVKLILSDAVNNEYIDF